MKTLPLTPEEDRARLVLRRILAFTETNGAELARLTGYLPQTISERLSGKSRVGIRDIAVFSEVLGVNPSLFFMEPDDAVRWLLDNSTVVPLRTAGNSESADPSLGAQIVKNLWSTATARRAA